MSRISLALKALLELGPQKLGLFALYKLGLSTCYFHWGTGSSQRSAASDQPSAFSFPLINLPNPDAITGIIGSDGLSQLKVEAEEIVNGHIRLFGGKSAPFDLTPPGELSHSTWFISS